MSYFRLHNVHNKNAGVYFHRNMLLAKLKFNLEKLFKSGEKIPSFQKNIHPFEIEELSEVYQSAGWLDADERKTTSSKLCAALHAENSLRVAILKLKR